MDTLKIAPWQVQQRVLRRLERADGLFLGRRPDGGELNPIT